MADSIDIQPEFEDDPNSYNQSDDISDSSRSRMPDPMEGRSYRKRSKLDQIVRDIAGNDPALRKRVREAIRESYKFQKNEVDEHNSILREIVAQGRKHHGALASNISQGLDATSLKGFDEAIQFAENNYPGFLGKFRGITNEDRLMEAIKRGIQDRPKITDDNIIEMALQNMGPLDEGEPIRPSQGSTDFNFGANVSGGGMGGGGGNDWVTGGFADDDFGDFGDEDGELGQFDPKSGDSGDRERQKKIRDAQRLQAKRDREQAARDRTLAAREHQDRMRDISAESRMSSKFATQGMNQIRSQATGARIGAYSLAASLGAHGYVAASIADSMFIQPAEQRAIEKQRQYQQDLDIYNRAVRQDEIERARRVKDDISNRPITAVALDELGNPIHPTTYSSAAGTGNGPGGGGTPPIGPGSPSPSNPGSSGGGPGTSPGGRGGNIPPVPPPIRPTPPGGGMGGAIAAAGRALPIVTAALEIAKMVNSSIESIGREAGTLTTSLAAGNAIAASKSSAKLIRKAIDPLGINVGAQIAVTGFDVLLDTTQAILESIKGTEGFAPQTLQASVEGDLARLFQQIEVARRLDPVTAELIRANTNFDLAWGELRAEFIETFAPAATATLNLIANYLKSLDIAVDSTQAVLNNVPNAAGSVMWMLDQILQTMNILRPDPIDAALTQQLQDFFNPSMIEKSLRQRGKFPR